MINAEGARLPLPRKAGHLIDGGLSHFQRNLEPQYARLAGSDAWCVTAHDASLPHGINHGRASSTWTGRFWCCANRLRGTCLDAIAASRAGLKELTFGHRARWSLQNGQRDIT